MARPATLHRVSPTPQKHRLQGWRRNQYDATKKPWRNPGDRFEWEKLAEFQGPFSDTKNCQGKLDQSHSARPSKLAWYLPKNSQRARHLQKLFSFEGMFNTGLFICRAPKPCSLHEFWSSENKMDWLTGMILTRSSTQKSRSKYSYMMIQYIFGISIRQKTWKTIHACESTTMSWLFPGKKYIPEIKHHKNGGCREMTTSPFIQPSGVSPMKSSMAAHCVQHRDPQVRYRQVWNLKLLFCISAVKDWRLRFVIIYVLDYVSNIKKIYIYIYHKH